MQGTLASVNANNDKPAGPKPGEDPWEFEWPDDAAEQREAEREAARKAAEVRPAPRFLTAYVLGTWIVLVFPLAVSLMARVPQFFVSIVAPIAIVGLVAALPLGMIVEVLTRRMKPGFVGFTFMLVGGFVGFYWTYAIMGWLISQSQFDPEVSAESLATTRMAGSLLMLAATATAFVTARNVTDRLRKSPKSVYAMAGMLLVICIPSAIWALQDLSVVFS